MQIEINFDDLTIAFMFLYIQAILLESSHAQNMTLHLLWDQAC